MPAMKYRTTNSKPSNLSGFTLIELLITTTLTVMLMLTITTLFITFLIGNSKTNIRKDVKEEGLHAMNQMEFLIRNAKNYDTSYQPCSTGRTAIRLIGFDGGQTRLYTIFENNVNKIAANNARLTSRALTVDTNSLIFDCSGEVGNRQITISFSLTKQAPTLGASENITESFVSTVNMRN